MQRTIKYFYCALEKGKVNKALGMIVKFYYVFKLQFYYVLKGISITIL